MVMSEQGLFRRISRITIIANLELNHLSFSLLVTTQFEVLASLDDQKLLLLRLKYSKLDKITFGKKIQKLFSGFSRLE